MNRIDSELPIQDGGSQRARGCPAAVRCGITLLEVLISMFVMLVGVISVFSLIALGRFEMLEGSKADRAMSLARRRNTTCWRAAFCGRCKWITSTRRRWGSSSRCGLVLRTVPEIITISGDQDCRELGGRL